MLKRTKIRRAAIFALLDDSTVLTLAGDDVFDTPIDLDTLKCGEDGGLPTIAVYLPTETLGVGRDDQWQELCFSQSRAELIIELYACASESHELEDVLDTLEEQVRIKLLPHPDFYPLSRLRGYRSRTTRTGDGRNIGLRAITLTLEYNEGVRPAETPDPATLTLNFQADPLGYVKNPASTCLI